jgi:phospholipid/cholesterol/gamma-HCH transport system permease protein
MVATLELLGRIGIFAARVGWATLTLRVPVRVFLQQLDIVIMRCMLPVMAVVFPFGMVMSLQGLEIFAMYSSQRLLSPFVAAAIIRELSPVMASTLVAAQGGASFAAELGAMRIKEELDATDVMGVDSLAFHAAPRVLALTVACPVLNLMGCVSGIFGGWITAVLMKGEAHGVFMAEMWNLTGPADVWGTVIKTTVFGALIGVVACYLGFHTRGGAAGVGRAVNDTVVYTILIFIAANYLLTSAFFGGMAP